MVVDGRFPGQGEGMTISDLQTLCQYFGLYEAMNFDGGGSSTLWTKEYGVINHPYDNRTFDHKGERKVPNALIVK
jgi:exopolysaccharide biosynthesis protein